MGGNRPKTLDVRELSGAADRALDEARRAITVLSVPQPQTLQDAIAQTAEDLGRVSVSPSNSTWLPTWTCLEK